jgi:hypothetical protein
VLDFMQYIEKRWGGKKEWDYGIIN